MTHDVEAATARLLSTVNSLPDADWAAPSHCAGWSRAHVIAHLALNAEGLAGVLRGIAEGRPRTMYTSNDDRDRDIEEMATEPPDRLRERLRSAAAAFDAALAASGPVPEGTTFERTPGGQVMPADVVPMLRLREVEIHHADLDAGYGWADWPLETARSFLDRDVRHYQGPELTLAPTDHPARWTVGDAGEEAVVVSGPIGALAWWSTGRDPGAVLSSSTGHLPTME